ncbi:MAG: ATP-grasp domain-containing protein [Pseudomonadota bacterium]|nr:ATP-grasp domain-containing protein [Pseudomonadota bacterium]
MHNRRRIDAPAGAFANDALAAPVVLLATTCHLPSTARLAMELEWAGAVVAAVCPADHPMRRTGALSRQFAYSAIRPVEALRMAIERAAPTLIIPCDERAVRHLHQLHTGESRSRSDLGSDHVRVRALIENSLGPASSFRVAERRHELLTLARRAGVRVPETRLIDGLDDLRGWHTEQTLPWVLKADGSWAGLGVRIVSTLAEAETAYLELSRPVSGMLAMREMILERDLFWLHPWLKRVRPVVSVQRYIDGRPANCGVACWQGEILAGTYVEVVTAESRTGSSNVVRVIDNEEMRQAATRVVSRLGMTGLVGFDFMIEEASGAAYLIEMNPRNTPICALRLGPGRDLIEALLARASSRVERARPPVTENDTIVFFPQTWQLDPGSEFLRTAYHDVPWEEPELLRVLVRPELRDRYWFTRRMRPLWQKVRSGRA